MGVNTVKQVLTSQLATSGTLVLTEKLDAYRHADAASHVLVIKNSAARYIAPTDFTVAVDGRGKATVTWLNAATLAIGTELNFGFWQYDSTSNGTQSGSGGGSGDASAANQLEMIAALGAPDDDDWTGSGDMTLAAGIRAIALAAIATAPAIVVQEAPSWVYIPASQTGTAGGNANDLLDCLLVIPATTSPGAVRIEDGAGTNYTLFAGGTDSVSTLIPFPIDMRNIPATTAWKITTGANMAAIAFYRPQT